MHDRTHDSVGVPAMSSTPTDDEVDQYVREQLEETDRDVLRAIVESDSPLAGRARRALDYLDELEGQE